MTLDPVAVVGALAAMGGLLLFITRAFATGAIMPRSVVPREDHDVVVTANKDLVQASLQQAEATMKVAALVERVLAKMNGGPV